MSAALPFLLLLALGAVDEHAFDADIHAAVVAVARVYPVPESLVRAVIRQESGFQPRVVSKAGAVGLMQVMPANAAKLGVRAEDLLTPRLNILAGVRLLAALLAHYQGDVVAALVGYNAGPRARLAPVPGNGETPRYVVLILRYWRAYQAEERQGASAGRTLPPRAK